MRRLTQCQPVAVLLRLIRQCTKQCLTGLIHLQASRQDRRLLLLLLLQTNTLAAYL